MNLKELSQYRSSLMGFAILWVVAYHMNLPSFIPYPLYEYGNLGVDIFFFLSSIGLSYSLSKDSRIYAFYQRRINRIIPIWWIMITFHLMLSLRLNSPHPTTLFQLICYYTGIGWLIHPDSTKYFCEWYVPTLLLFYVIAPFLFRRSIRFLLFLLLSSIMIGILLSYNSVGCPLDRAYMRFPVFISGFVYFKCFYNIDVSSNEKCNKIGNENAA